MEVLSKYGIERVVLPNGMEIIVKKLDSFGVSGNLIVRCGSVYEIAENNGISHFLEHLVYISSGRGGRRSSPIYQSLKYGGDIDAATCRTYTEYPFFFVQKKWAQSLRLLLDAVAAPRFSLENFKQEKAVILNECATERDMPDEEVNKHMFRRHQLRWSVEGSPRSVSRITLEKIKSWHNKFYRPNRMTLIVAGSITLPRVLRVLRRSKLYNLDNHPRPVIEPPLPVIQWNKTYPIKIGSQNVKMAFASPETPRDNIYFRHILMLLLDASIVGTRWFLARKLGMYIPFAVNSYFRDQYWWDNTEEVSEDFAEVADNYCHYITLDFFGIPLRNKRRLISNLFNWIQKVHANGLERFIFKRAHYEIIFDIINNAHDTRWWTTLLSEAVIQKFLSNIDLFLNMPHLSEDGVKKEVERVFRATIGKRWIIFNGID